MRRIVGLAGLMVIASAAAVSAQTVDEQCRATTDEERASQDACQKAIDVFKYMAPQLGGAISGGNPTLGQGGTLGGFPRYVVGFRVNALQGSLPRLEQPSVNGAQQTTIQTQARPLPMPVVDAGVGVFGGFLIPGYTRVGGIDLLVSASYLPTYKGDRIEVQRGGLKVGYGARLGLLQESLTMPGLAVSYMRRDLPTVDIISSTESALLTGTRDTVEVSDLSVKTSGWRITANKSFVVFGVALGAGQDNYDSDANLRAVVHLPPLAGFGQRQERELEFDQELTRTNYFLDLYFNVGAARLVGEIGVVQGGDVDTYNRFDGKSADDSRLYGSLGIRIGR